MPSNNGASWFCDRCGAGGFRDFNDANAHELSCDMNSARKRRRPGSPSSAASQYTNSNTNSSAEKSQNMFPPSQNRSELNTSPFPPIPFIPFILIKDGEQAAQNLSQLDVITCQNVEMFKATAEDVADHDGSVVNIDQIGLRCIHCAKTPFAKAEFSAVFPAAMGSVAASLRMMTEVHFEKCTSLPRMTKTHLEQAKNASGRSGEEVEWNRAAFGDFCLSLCKKHNMVNRSPAQTGLVLGQQIVSNDRADIYSTQNIPLMQPTLLASSSNQRNQAQPDSMNPAQMKSSLETQSQYGATPQSVQSGQQSLPQHMLQPPMSSTPRSGSGSPPSLYDSPGSASYPFCLDAYGFWVCRFCNNIPFSFRAPGSIWQSTQPPTRSFMEQHLNQCRYQTSNQGVSTFSNTAPYPSPSQGYLGQVQNASGWGSPQRQSQLYHNQSFPQGSPQTSSRPPRAPSQGQYQAQHHNNASPSGVPSQAYPYQIYQQSHGYPNVDISHDTTPSDMVSGGYQGVDHHNTYIQQDQGPESSEVTMKAAIEHLTKAEKDHPASEETELVLSEDKLLLTDYFYHVMKQLRPCRFSESDRKTRGGKRENIAIGYGGLQCVHCAESPNPRKFFWSNVDRLANSFAEIPSHVLKCRRCPIQTKQALQELKLGHPDQMSQMPRGSQKVFFRRMWRRIHDKDPGTETGTSKVSSEQSTSNEKDKGEKTETSEEIKMASSTALTPHVKTVRRIDSARPSPGDFTVGMSTENAARNLARYSEDPSIEHSCVVLLAIDEDKEWLSDMDCFVRENVEVFCASGRDVDTAQSDRKYPVMIGQVGIRCLHCAKQASGEGARGTAVSFPYSISGIYESVREFQRLHLESCPNLPQDVSKKLAELKGSSSLSSVLRRYYVLAAKALGMHDTSDGIKAGALADVFGDSSEKQDLSSNIASSSLSATIRAVESESRVYINDSPLPKINRKRKLSESETEKHEEA